MNHDPFAQNFHRCCKTHDSKQYPCCDIDQWATICCCYGYPRGHTSLKVKNRKFLIIQRRPTFAAWRTKFQIRWKRKQICGCTLARLGNELWTYTSLPVSSVVTNWRAMFDKRFEAQLGQAIGTLRFRHEYSVLSDQYTAWCIECSKQRHEHLGRSHS